MASKTLHSNQVTFLDYTDDRKLDVYITSTLPTSQIFNTNTKVYSPDWSSTNLKLSADIFLDSQDVTINTNTSIKWYRRIGSDTRTHIANGSDIIIATNQMSNNITMITYICEAEYQGIIASAQITFTRMDTGLNGVDGTSVNILGSYDTLGKLQEAHPTGNAGDAYIVDGNLYVWATDDNQWEDVGNIQGPAGKDAKSIILNGDSQVFKVSNTNVITPSTISVTAQSINTSVTAWSYSVNGGQTFLSTAPNGVVRNGDIVTITGSNITSNMVVIKASDGTYSDTYTIYKVFDGANGIQGDSGDSAPIAFLTNENVTFSADEKGRIQNTAVTSNIVAYNGVTKVLPIIGEITGVPEGMTITKSSIEASNEIMLTITITNNATLGSALSNMGTINIPIISPISSVLTLNWSKINTGATGSSGSPGAPGADAYTVILTNESNTFAGDVSNAIAGTTSTQVIAYKGSAVQPITIKSVNGIAASIVDTETGIVGLKFKCSALSGTLPTITFTCTTTFKSASGSIPIVLSVGDVSFTKMFTYSIAFKGATGDTGQTGSIGLPATSYWLISSASAVQKTSTGTITVTPSTLTFTGKSQTGTATPIDYACRWIISYSTDGTNYTDLYTSITNEVSKSITVATTYKTIRARMYLAGGTTTLLDEQIIPIISDGIKGDQGVAAVSFQIYAPNGYLLTKELTSLTLQTFAYEGSTAITSGATYQWSQFVDNAWVDMSGATSTTITVTKADVLKAKTYQCIMTYKSKEYTSTITIQDKTDIYNSIMCISSNATNNDCYWVLYTLVYSDTEEVDPLLGPISINAPTSPESGDYWYAVDSINATVTLKKYNGTSWADSTDKQSLFYYWDMINDGSAQIPLGDSSKVKVISCHDFTSTATLVCEVSNLEDGLLTQSSLSLTDASDPIVSDTEPTATVSGQIWIKPNDNGTYLMFIWDESVPGWISSDMDTRSKVYTSRPSSYNAGDLWITASDTDHGSYLQGTLLQAQVYNTAYNEADWSPTLRYDQDLDDMKETLNNLSQYVTITSSGLRVAARDDAGNLSEFTSLFTSEALTFYQGSKELLILANNQLTAPKIVVEDELDVQGEIKLGDLKLIIESNGSFSFAVQK